MMREIGIYENYYIVLSVDGSKIMNISEIFREKFGST